VGYVLTSPPVPEVAFDEWFPCNPCLISPESADGYPHIADLPPDLRQRIHAWEATLDPDSEVSCPNDLSSPIRGTRAGGHPSWGGLDPTWPTCVCGRRMTYLLSITDDDGHDLILKGELVAFACTSCPDAPLDYVVT